MRDTASEVPKGLAKEFRKGNESAPKFDSVGETGDRSASSEYMSVKDARSGEGGKGDNRGSTAKVEFCESMLKVMAGLIDLLRSALLVGMPRPTGPTPKPRLSLPRASEPAETDDELATRDCDDPRVVEGPEG